MRLAFALPICIPIASAFASSPVLACVCEEDLRPLTVDDLEPFDLIFSGVARESRPFQSHTCGPEDEGIDVWRVEVSAVWRGDVALNEVVGVVPSSCQPDLPLDVELIITARRQSDGSAIHTGISCRPKPDGELLTEILGPSSTATSDSSMPSCFPSCGSTEIADTSLFCFAVLLGLVRRQRQLAVLYAHPSR